LIPEIKVHAYLKYKHISSHEEFSLIDEYFIFFAIIKWK